MGTERFIPASVWALWLGLVSRDRGRGPPEEIPAGSIDGISWKTVSGSLGEADGSVETSGILRDSSGRTLWSDPCGPASGAETRPPLGPEMMVSPAGLRLPRHMERRAKRMRAARMEKKNFLLFIGNSFVQDPYHRLKPCLGQSMRVKSSCRCLLPDLHPSIP